jgi:hypothetical protein
MLHARAATFCACCVTATPPHTVFRYRSRLSSRARAPGALALGFATAMRTRRVVTLQPLSVLTSLQSLTLRQCYSMTDLVLPALPLLETLDLCSSRRSGRYLTAIPTLYPRLTSLSLPLFRDTDLSLHTTWILLLLLLLLLSAIDRSIFGDSRPHSSRHRVSLAGFTAANATKSPHTVWMQRPSERAVGTSGSRASHATADDLYALCSRRIHTLGTRKCLYLDLS